MDAADRAAMPTTGQTSIPASDEDQCLPAVICWQLDDVAPSAACGKALRVRGQHRVTAVAGSTLRMVVLTENGTALESSVNKCAFRAVCEQLTLVSCGESHTVALTSDGQPVTWGGSDPPRTPTDLQLAPNQKKKKSGKKNQQELAAAPARAAGETGITATRRPVPFTMDPLQRVQLEQVSCGDHHTLALSSASVVFAWGMNDRGQLGLGPTAPPSARDPQALRDLCGIPVRSLAAGAAHGVSVTLTGGVFSWGANAHGQLGLDQPQDVATPVRVESLRPWSIAHASCGAQHTALLTEEGTVLVIGGAATPATPAAAPATPAAAAPGAAAAPAAPTSEPPSHSCVVTECGVSGISQIACSRYHTAALSADSSKIYLLATDAAGGTPAWSCGLGGAATELTVDGVSPGGPPGAGRFIVKHIFAGGNCIYATCAAEESQVHPNGTRSPQICTITPDLSRKLTSKSRRLPQALEQQLDVAISSAACLNGSFLSPRPSPEHSLGLDLEEAKRLLQNINRKLLPKVSALLHGDLVSSLKEMRPDKDSLRVLALLLLLPAATSDLPGLTAAAVDCVTRLPDPLRHLFEQWLAHLPKADFIHILKACTNVLLEYAWLVIKERRQGKEELEMPVGLTEFLTNLKEIKKTSVDMTEEDFHDSRLNDLLSEMHEMLLHKGNQQHSHQLRLQQSLALLQAFTKFPFLFDSKTKILLFELTAVFLAQHYSDLYNMQLKPYGLDPQENPTLPLIIRRSNLLEDTITMLRMQPGSNIWMQLQVSLFGENVGGPGVNAEFFHLFMEELLKNEAIGFQQNKEKNLLWFSEEDVQNVLIGKIWFPCSEVYWVVGLVCGLAVYNRVLVDFHFPLALYKKLLGIAPDLSDLQELSPRLARSMNLLLADSSENLQDTFSNTFTYQYECSGQVFVRELIPGGSRTMVTQQNKHEYVERFVRHTFGSDVVQRKFEKFAAGFTCICKVLCYQLLSPQELRDVAFGKASYDWLALEKCVIYDIGFSSRHETIRMFWEVFRELSDEQKKHFLIFVTGSDRVPLTGMKMLGIHLSISNKLEDLPQAHTCFHRLYLPAYGEKSLLRDKLMVALEHRYGFAPL